VGPLPPRLCASHALTACPGDQALGHSLIPFLYCGVEVMSIPDTPDKHIDTPGWERAWASRIDNGLRRRRLLDFPGIHYILYKVPWDEQTAYHAMCICDAVLKVQRGLAAIAVPALGEDAFDEKWIGLPKARREAMLLAGIYRVCAVSEDIERRREYCPDVTVEALEADGGRGYLTLLRKLLPSDSTAIPDGPINVSHPSVDAFLRLNFFEARIPIYRQTVATFHLMRMSFIGLVVVAIIRDFVSLRFVLANSLGLTARDVLLVRHGTGAHSVCKNPYQAGDRVEDAKGCKCLDRQ
jgi:hypothetical protein